MAEAVRLDKWVPFNELTYKKSIRITVRARNRRDKRVLEVRYVPLIVEVIGKYFPELRGIRLNLYATYTSDGRYITEGYPYNLAINPKLLEESSEKWVKHVIAHELTHLIQYNFDDFVTGGREHFQILYMKPFPHGEESCDLYVYARHPDLVIQGRGSYIEVPGSADPNEVHELALEAIRLRNEKGVRTYIRWFKKRLYG